MAVNTKRQRYIATTVDGQSINGIIRQRLVVCNEGLRVMGVRESCINNKTIVQVGAFLVLLV